MYKALARPHLDYCDIIYHPSKASRSKLYEELGWEPLSDRRRCTRIQQVQKILNNMTPSYIQNKLPRRRRPVYRLNINNNFYEIRCKSSKYMNSFFADRIKAWNNAIGIFQTFHLLISLRSYLISSSREKQCFQHT